MPLFQALVMVGQLQWDSLYITLVKAQWYFYGKRVSDPEGIGLNGIKKKCLVK